MATKSSTLFLSRLARIERPVKSTLVSITDGNGTFSLEHAPTGYYNVWADLPPFRMDGQRSMDVPEIGCGYTDIQLT